MMDVPTDEQLPEPVKLRATCKVQSVRRVEEAGTHPTSADHVSGPIQTASNGETVGKNQVNSLLSIPDLGERDAPRFLICVCRSSNGERNVEVCPGKEQAGDEAGTRDQRRRIRLIQ